MIIAGSDFQGNIPENKAVVKGILSQMKADGYTDIDGAFFCGDYTIQLNNLPSDSEEGLTALQSIFTKAEMGIEKDEMIFVQGNHDPVGTFGLSLSGIHAPKGDAYGVFVINEDDYMWKQGKAKTNGNASVLDDSDQIAQTAESLDTYLEMRYDAEDETPVFILSHLPLHYTMRTYNDGDARYASYIFDVLQKWADRGLNIFFLFGHNHSNGWDNYLGGASIYMEAGDTIYLSDPEDAMQCYAEELNFTYMNAGYVGYYTTSDEVDETLTMTLFEIYEEKVVVKRYSEQGVHTLKGKGEYNSYSENREARLAYYAPYLNIYESGREVWMKEILPMEEENSDDSSMVAPPLVSSPNSAEDNALVGVGCGATVGMSVFCLLALAGIAVCSKKED